MGFIDIRHQRERNLARAVERAQAGGSSDGASPETAHRRLTELAAALQAARPSVTNDTSVARRHARALAAELNLGPEEQADLVMAAELHDLGKAFLPRDVLETPGELDTDTRALVESHPLRGAELVEATGREGVVATIAAHGRRFDEAGDEIPVGARSLAVVTSFVAMTSKRPYREALDRDHALEILREESGRQFDPEIVTAFIPTVPDRKVAPVVAGITAALARPVRAARLTLARRGRFSTAALAATLSAVLVIGASTLAPDGITEAFERVVWPDKSRTGVDGTGEIAGTSAAAPSSDQTGTTGSTGSSVAGALGSDDGTVPQVLGNLIFNDDAGAIGSEYSYWGSEDSDTGEVDGDGWPTDGGYTDGDGSGEGYVPPEEEPTPSEEPTPAPSEEPQPAEDDKHEGKPGNANGHDKEDKGGKNEEAEEEPSPSPSPSPSSEPSQSPSPSESPG